MFAGNPRIAIELVVEVLSRSSIPNLTRLHILIDAVPPNTHAIFPFNNHIPDVSKHLSDQLSSVVVELVGFAHVRNNNCIPAIFADAQARGFLTVLTGSADLSTTNS